MGGSKVVRASGCHRLLRYSFYTTPMPTSGPNKAPSEAYLDLVLGRGLVLGWGWYRRAYLRISGGWRVHVPMEKPEMIFFSVSL